MSAQPSASVSSPPLRRLLRASFRALAAASARLARFAPLFVTLAAAAALWRPVAFDWMKGDVQTAILGVIMLSMGLTLSGRDFAILARNPLAMAVGALAQFTVMPLLAWSIAHALRLSPGLTVGLILVGCCPGGVSSNIMSFLCKGDVAYSVGMTAVSTLLAPIATPLLTAWLAGAEVPVDAVGMFKSILWITLLPVLSGVALNALFGRTRAYAALLRLMPGVAVLGLMCIVGGVAAHDGDEFLRAGAIIFLAIFLHNTGGYLLGYGAALLFRMPRPRRRTLSIEVGVQNAGLGTVLAGRHFAGLAGAEPIAAASCIYHSIAGTVLARLYVFLDRRFPKWGI